jgi:hypothetical protein
MVSQCFFVCGEISPNFDLKNMILANTRIFHGKNGPNSPNFTPKKPQIVRFYDKFHQVAKNIERFSLFSTFISRMWPNLAK